MRGVFGHMNMSGDDVCPVCGKKEDKPVMLVTLDGTQGGNIAQAIQVHVGCLNLSIKTMSTGEKIIYQRIGG